MNKKGNPTNGGKMSRRGVLRVGTAAAGITGLAGCSALPGGLGGGFNYAQYLPDPDEFDQEEYQFNYHQPTVIAENEDEFEDEVYDEIIEDFGGGVEVDELFDIDFDEIEHAVSIGFEGILILDGSFDKEDVVDQIEDDGLDDGDEISGYETYYTESENAGVAIQDETILLGHQSNITENLDSDEILELIIGAENGEEDRYADTYESFEILTNNLDAAANVFGRASDDPDDITIYEDEYDGLENLVAVGSSTSINGDTTNLKVVYVHEDQDDIDTDAAQESIEDEDFFDNADDFTVSSSGRATIVTAEYDTDELESIYG